MKRAAFLACVLALATTTLSAAPVRAEPDADGVERYELENGLKVRLRPLTGAKNVAVLVLFDVGEAHDPEGQSGLAHLVEHCYVTSAAGKTPVRTAEAMMAAYPQAWNAQTGNDYTAIAFIAPASRMAAEVAEAAARMGDLRVTNEDLSREKPRMALELANMYERVPMLAASNQARARALPAAPGARKGGVEAQLESVSTADVLAHHRAYYKPGNARLVLVGGFDPDAARALVKEQFGAIARGEALPTPRTPAPATRGKASEVELDRAVPGAPAVACLARRAPTPDAATYPAFLILLKRLFEGQARTSAQSPKVIYSLIDAPEILFAQAPTAEDGTAADACAVLQGMLDASSVKALTPLERFQTRQAFAYLLGTHPIPEAALANNPYAVAFGIGRREQMGIDGVALGARLSEVTDADLKLAAETLFAPANGTDVLVRPAHAAKPAR